jgi:urease accessory protein
MATMIMRATNREKSPRHRGSAHLTVENVLGQSAITSTESASPIKILVPKSRGQSVWAYASSFGGGLVAGDQTRIDLTVGADARCFLGTQASTKIYRNPKHLPCSHTTSANLQTNSLLVFAPDPVQAFADSRYSQRQEFRLAPDAGLVLVDWFTSGRAARGERWNFSHFQSRNEVFITGKRIFLDSILLDAANGFTASSHQVGRYNCFATLLLLGTSLEKNPEKLLQEISTRPVERRAMLVSSASAIPGGALLRIAGESVEEVGRELHHHLKFVAPLLGDDPWLRKW